LADERAPECGNITRKVSVAPMMDWTDSLKKAQYVRCLRLVRNSCSKLVATKSRSFAEFGTSFAPMSAEQQIKSSNCLCMHWLRSVRNV